MERPTRDYMIPTLSAELAMEEDLKALTMDVIALTQSLTDYVYEMSEHDDDTYDSSEGIFEEDADYTARGEDCHYFPMLEDEITNYYYSPPLQNQQGRQDDEEQEEPSLAELMAQMIAAQTQMMATQAQQGKYMQLLTSELQQERAARRMLETQVAQHEENLLSHNKVVEEDEHHEPEKEEESMEKEVATHHVQTLESHDLSSIPLEDVYPDRKVRKALERLTDDCTSNEFLKCLSQAYHDDTSCAKDERVPEYENLFSNDSCMTEQLDEGHDQGHEDFVEVSVDQFPEKSCFKINTSSKEYFGDLAPKTINEQLEESTLIKSKSDFEDPFLQPLPQDKFQSFLPFMSCTLDESFNNPFHLKEIKYNRGLIARREVPRRLGGREYKWDFKLDKLQSMQCTIREGILAKDFSNVILVEDTATSLPGR